MKDKLTALLATLNTLEVRGKDNLQALLGCLWALEELLAEPTGQEQEETHGR